MQSELATRLSLLFRVRDISDDGSWREFVQCYAPRVFYWCRKFGLQDADAADATQMVLLKLVDCLQLFEYDPEQGRFRGWLKTVTRNVAADVGRQWRERGLGVEVMEIAGAVDGHPSPDEELYEAIESAFREEMLRAAEERVRLRVQPDTWQAYWLCCREQLTAPAAAARLGIAVTDVYVAKSRILKQLRAELGRLNSTESD